MSSLFDIGRAGLQSYRRALSVTGQNIANVNTDGYKRREASLEEVSAGTGGIYSVGNNSGLGVRVADITRSFDEFLLNKARNAGSNAQTSGSYLESLKQLQALLLPGDANIGTALETFFSSLHDVSNVPAEMGPRVVAIDRGEAVADTFNAVARGINELKDGIVTQVNQNLEDLNVIAEGILNINSQLTRSESSSSKALLDGRDQLIDEASKFAEVNVTLDAQGRATLRLGDSLAGPKLVDAVRAYTLRVDALDDRLMFKVGGKGTETLTNQVKNGSIAGFANGYRTVHETGAKVDDLAHLVLRDLNAAHRKGLTLDGEAGGDMFLTRRPFVETGPANVGKAYAEVVVEDVSLIEPSAVTFTYNAKSGKWIGRDVFGNDVASGKHSVRLPGMQVRFFGEAFDNDDISVNPARGAAESMLFALTRGEQIAAASSRLSYADSANTSNADITVSDAAAAAATTVPELTNVLSNSISTVASTQFLKDGAIATVPRNFENLDLVSMTGQAEANFAVSAAYVPDLTMLTIGMMDESGVSSAAAFSLSSALLLGSGESWSDVGQIADMLNVGGITGYTNTGQAVKLADLGIMASGHEGRLTLAKASGEFASASLSHASGTINGEITAPATTASNIQVFTRDGRHIAGSAIDAGTQASLMTEANGFYAEAQYNDSYLNVDGGYLGVGVTRRATATDNLISSSVSGASGTFAFRRLGDIDGRDGSHDGMSAHAESASYTLNVEGFEKTVTVADFGTDASDEDVARAMITKFRADAPAATMEGSVVAAIPDDGTSVSVSFEDNIYQISMVEGEVVVSGGEEGRLRAFFGNDDKLYISSTSGTISASQITVLGEADLSGNTVAANAFGLTAGASGPVPAKAGFSAYDYELTIDGAIITATRTSQAATLTASASAKSAASERLILTGLPDEELLVLISGGGARKISASYDVLPDTAPSVARDLTVKVLDATAGTVEFIDTDTGTSLANRTLDSNAETSAFGVSVKLEGIIEADDRFHVTGNANGIGDASNLAEITALQNGVGDRGGFQKVFASVVSGVGSTVQSTKVTNDAAIELHNASLEMEASFSGVSLDAEAANLIQQQQAYQASARILATAREIFRTLLEAV